MYCTECGSHNPDTERQCSTCGAGLLQPTPAQPPLGEAPEPIQNYLVASILATLCCCVPFGIVSIVYAAGVDGKVASGDIAGAIEASKKAKMWAWISFGAAIAAWAVYLLLALIGGIAGGFE